MKGQNDVSGSRFEFLYLVDPDNDAMAYNINLTFLRSKWTCIFGKGCCGLFGEETQTLVPSKGCCDIGFATDDPEDFARVKERVNQLTPEDWEEYDPKLVEKWWVGPDNPKFKNGKTVNSKVHNGRCVFSNSGAFGKPGCAFHHLGQRIGVSEHVDIMPDVCWEAPIRTNVHVIDTGQHVMTVDAWDADEWGGMDEDGTHDSWMKWWCMDTPDAFVGDEIVLFSLEKELRKILTDKIYELVVKEVMERNLGNGYKMPGLAEGRPTLKLLIADRTIDKEA